MPPFPSLLVLTVVFGLALGFPLGLYAWLTRERRRAIGEIRREVLVRGWRYQRRRWQGNPAAFRIHGRGSSGLNWVLTSGSAAETNQGWSVRLAVRVPALAGEMDFAVLPRDPAGRAVQMLRGGLLHELEQRIAFFSGTAANAINFLENAREIPLVVFGFAVEAASFSSGSVLGLAVVAATFARAPQRGPALCRPVRRHHRVRGGQLLHFVLD